jgi:hypothetical protein
MLIGHLIFLEYYNNTFYFIEKKAFLSYLMALKFNPTCILSSPNNKNRNENQKRNWNNPE